MQPLDEGYAYFSDSLGGVMATMTGRQKQLVIDMYKHYLNEYRLAMFKNDTNSVIYSFHAEIDKQIEELFAVDPDSKDIKCKKGCYYCCQQHVDVSPPEIFLILEHLREKKIDIDIDLLERQSEYNIETWHDQPEDDWSCVFLQKDHSCAVYEHRPASCRKYFVTSLPKLCDTKRRHQVVKRFVCTPAEIIGSVIFNTPGSGTLPKLLYQIIKENDPRRKSKIS